MLFINKTGYMVLGRTVEGDEIRPYQPPTERRTVQIVDVPAAEPLAPSAVVLGLRPYDPRKRQEEKTGPAADLLPPGYRPY